MTVRQRSPADDALPQNGPLAAFPPFSRRALLRWCGGVGVGTLAALLGAAACSGPPLNVPATPTVREGRSPLRRQPAGPTPGSGTAAAAGAKAAPASVPLPTPGRPSQPHVLLVTIDTLRADRLGCYGYARAHTPVLDRLAREGVRFEQAICQLPQTNASHAALMTGLYPSTNGVKVHMVDKLPPGSQTLASVFADAGYRTAGIYSWVSLDEQFCGLDQGFQTYEGYVLNRSVIFSDPRLESLAATYRQIKAALPILKTADLVLGSSEHIEESLDGRADVTNAAVFKWLDAQDGSDPFFLWVHYFDPHYPYAPPRGFDHLFGLDYHGSIDGSVDTIHKIVDNQIVPSPADRARLEELYQGEIAFTDTQLGRLVDYLTRRGWLDNTILVITGDHGESFGEHDDWTHGLKVYQSEIRVPLILRYPPRLPTGAVVETPVQLIDIMPTLLDLTGISAAKPVQGTSMLPILSGKVDDTRAAFTEMADEAFVSVLTWGKWKLIRNNANGQLQLYRLDVDEAETHDLAAQEARTARELNARLQDLMKLSGVSH
ncbi:MAG: sulfatase [Chloroflexi bacterium]|nr:sulfatase [Chloroflexota bacterium]